MSVDLNECDNTEEISQLLENVNTVDAIRTLINAAEFAMTRGLYTDEEFQLVQRSIEQARLAIEGTKKEPEIFDGFDWVVFSGSLKDMIISEMKDSIYEKVFQVQAGDTVVDIGASVGPFIRSILKKDFEKCYAVEPGKLFGEAIERNTDARVKVISAGITEEDCELEAWDGTFSRGIRFMDLIQEEGIGRIDFMKIDCEGGEYEIFREENLEWLKTNCKYCVGEWHLYTAEHKEKFRRVRDLIFPQLKTVIVKSVDGVEITWSLHTDHFIEYYSEVIIHIEI